MQKFKYLNKNKLDNLPKTSGVYCFIKFAETRSLQICRDRVSANFLYIGKANDIRQRVKNHIQQPVFKDTIFVPLADKIGFIETNSEIEALLLEAELIKKYQPKYNVEWKDGKSHNFIFITKENFPRLFIAHQLLSTNYKLPTNYIGPFVDSKGLKQTLRLLRKVFPFRTCSKMPKKPCLYKELSLCLAPCLYPMKPTQTKNITNYDDRHDLLWLEYQKNIKNLVAILKGKKAGVLQNLKKEMTKTSSERQFEKAAKLRDQISALEQVFANAHILEKTASQNFDWPRIEKKLKKLLGLKTIKRIEGYDVSNIQGKMATASMVVFENGLANKNEYRKFKIKMKNEPNDTAMLKEALERRLKHGAWPMPDVILIDGGIGQLNVGLKLKMKNTKIISLAKKNNQLFIEDKAKPILLKNLPPDLANLILRLRDEAHRFAISYHRNLRSKKFF